MKAVKYFESFLEEGIVKKQLPDKPRAGFLMKEAEQNYGYLLKLIEKMGVNNLNSNDYIKKCYDILMELVRAKMLLEGFNASGQGAHEAEVSYLRSLGFNETEVQFLDQIRFFRNGMLYYGTILDKGYAEKVLEFLNKIHPKLVKLIENKLR